MAFSKLDSGIVDSSLWAEPLATRVVFVTMLAKKNYKGEVLTARSGLLRAANVPEPDFDEAIKCLESPDKDSRSDEFEGRRIEKIPGGWRVLNHYKYRDYTYSETPSAIRQRKHREKENECDMSQMSRNDRDISVSVSGSDIPLNSNNPELIQEPPTWKADFKTYTEDARKEFQAALSDPEWMKDRRRYFPRLDIALTLEKAFNDFWGQEAGWHWMRKKKTKSINWRNLINNVVDNRKNWVYAKTK
ncbi:MAG: hypothetical protein WC657_08420 [Candidatus Paceibacterota bacterium]|jgi:hypothetical protein